MAALRQSQLFTAIQTQMPAGKQMEGLRLKLTALPADRFWKEGAGGFCACWKSRSA